MPPCTAPSKGVCPPTVHRRGFIGDQRSYRAAAAIIARAVGRSGEQRLSGFDNPLPTEPTDIGIRNDSSSPASPPYAEENRLEPAVPQAPAPLLLPRSPGHAEGQRSPLGRHCRASAPCTGIRLVSRGGSQCSSRWKGSCWPSVDPPWAAAPSHTCAAGSPRRTPHELQPTCRPQPCLCDESGIRPESRLTATDTGNPRTRPVHPNEEPYWRHPCGPGQPTDRVPQPPPGPHPVPRTSRHTANDIAFNNRLISFDMLESPRRPAWQEQ